MQIDCHHETVSNIALDDKRGSCEILPWRMLAGDLRDDATQQYSNFSLKHFISISVEVYIIPPPYSATIAFSTAAANSSLVASVFINILEAATRIFS